MRRTNWLVAPLSRTVMSTIFTILFLSLLSSFHYPSMVWALLLLLSLLLSLAILHPLQLLRCRLSLVADDVIGCVVELHSRRLQGCVVELGSRVFCQWQKDLFIQALILFTWWNLVGNSFPDVLYWIGGYKILLTCFKDSR